MGDDDDGPAAVAIRDTLSRAAERRAVHVMHGNRDFLFGARFAAETGVTLLEDPAVIDVDGERVLIAHGDAYCTRDLAYQEAREQLRSKAWQAGVLAMGLTERRTLAAGLRARSVAANENKAANIMDVTPSAVRRRHGCRPGQVDGPRAHPPSRYPCARRRPTPDRARRLAPLRMATDPGVRRRGLELLRIAVRPVDGPSAPQVTSGS